MDVLMVRRCCRLSSGSAQAQPHFSLVQLVLEELAGVEGAAGSEAELKWRKKQEAECGQI